MNLAPVPDISQPELAARLQHKLDNKTKPRGSLGRLETLALQLGLILGSEDHQLRLQQLRRVAAQDQDFLAGGAAVSVLARQQGLTLTVVDCGVRRDFAARQGLVIRKIAPGTADSSIGPAMSASQCEQAIANGRALVDGLPGNALLLGEMGIGNTSAASLLLARLAGQDLAECVGAGTGLDAAGIEHKRQVLQQVLALHEQATTPLQALAAFGGFEIATMAGAVLQAAARRRVIVVDERCCRPRRDGASSSWTASSPPRRCWWRSSWRPM
jgi:nicotinate-nucleotide--dimethylbenzimidazole phosphoribosyltransferase